MPGLVHDAALRRASNCRTRGVARSQRMTCVAGRVKSSSQDQFLNHPRNICGPKAAGQHLAMSVNRAENRAVGGPCRFKPRLQHANRAGIEVGPVGFDGDPSWHSSSDTRHALTVAASLHCPNISNVRDLNPGPPSGGVWPYQTRPERQRQHTQPIDFAGLPGA